MHSDFSPKPLFLALLCLIAASACKKGSSPAGDSGNSTPAITAIGTPVGSPVNKDIDATGGTLTSPDGKLDVTIPAGALSASTTISIQPVTNTAPGGIGSAYQLLPEGTKFSKPVTITFHYSDDDISGSLPYFVYIAFQDSAFSWEADLKQRNLDTVAKTVSITSSHFSIWSAFENIKLISGQDEYHEGETNYLEVTEILKPGTLTPGGDANDPLSYSLPVASTLPDNIVSNWSLNGEGQNTLTNGNITGSGAHTMYKAPASIEQETTVSVSVVVKFTEIITSYSSGKVIATFNKLVLVHPIELLSGYFNFSLEIEIARSQPQGNDPTASGYIYHDHATMDIKIEGDSVYFSNIQNFPPDYTIQDGTDCVITYVYGDPIGLLNIVAAQGYADMNQGLFRFSLFSKNGHYIKIDMKCNCQTCTVQTSGGSAIGDESFGSPSFKLDAITQNYLDGDDIYHTKMTLTPK